MEPFWRPKGDPQRSHRRAPEELQRLKMSPRRRQEAQKEPQEAPGGPK